MPEIEKHLHQLSQLIREQDSIKLVVRLESSVGSRIRYLAVVSCMEHDAEEFCLLGIDCDRSISLGLVLAILSYTTIRLDGDGGFCVTTGDGHRSHIFKPVSVQTMWSALQSLYRASECAKENNSFQASAVRYYENVFSTHKSDTCCLNEWNILPGVENRRPLISSFSSEELSFQEKISCTLREILLCEKDLDEVTSKEIRTKLEAKLQVDLSHYKSFIDEEMLKILGQMEAPALILDNLYLGTEWNASHQQDLFDKNISYILNATTEIDNFFPDTFRYLNIPVCDNEETDILRYFNDSYRFINKARKEGKNVLVHCKMGISRSATIVIAYVMKARNWDLCRTLRHVKERRNCIKPNPNFMKQLEIYEGILTAKRLGSTLEKRSKSESNLKQNDKSVLLDSSSDKAMCSSNSDLSNTCSDLKPHKKYFNTAPARLKPEKYDSLLGDLLKPKSSSCASIQVTNKVEVNSLVPEDVMFSFEEVVSILEELPRRKTRMSLEIPVVTITEDTPDGDEVKLVTDPSSEVNNSCVLEYSERKMTNSVSTTGSDDNLNDTQSNVTNPEEKQNFELKCCRRPYNGHTFSVSPNQVVNITSVVDSKFSVRHLVNQFEVEYQSNKSVAPTSDTSGTSVALDKSSESVIQPTQVCLNDLRTPDNSSKLVVDTEKSSKPSKKIEKLGCLQFFRKSLSVKSSQSKNSVGPSSYMKKTNIEKPKDRPKEKVRCKGKILETVAKLNESGENINSLEESLAVKYQSTGVVKQRREVFEAIAVPNSKNHNSFFRSHNRSHSAAGSSSIMSYDTGGHLAQRKSSMPQLGAKNSDFEASFPQRLPIFQLHERKASLDSNGIFKTFPCPMVRGFQNSDAKSFFSTSPSSNRQQHGSTHPLNLLPRTPTLT